MAEKEKSLKQLKEEVVAVRSRGPVSQKKALEMAEEGAELDDSEGLGDIKVVKKKEKC